MTPRTLVFSLFGDFLRYCGRGEVPLGALSRLLELFDVEPGTTRVAMTRLRKEGWFTTERNGREVAYLLSDRGWELLDEGRARIFGRRDRAWDRSWSMVIIRFTEAQRGARDEARKKLAWLGFGQLSASTWMCAHPRLDEAERALEGLPQADLDLLTCTTRGAEEDRRIAERCWDLGQVQRDYAQFVDRFEHAGGAEGTGALVALAELTTEYRQFPFRDPDLPAELLPKGWTGAAAHDLFSRVYASLLPAADAVVEEIVGLQVDRPRDALGRPELLRVTTR